LQLGEKSLRTMERLVRAQEKRPNAPQQSLTPEFASAAAAQ
jgi:hypothetical protein